MSDRNIRWNIIGEIMGERIDQIDAGMDTDHDDRQPLAHFAWLLARRANDLAAPNLELISKDEPRRLLVEIAAIAVAAVEAIDRQTERDDHVCFALARTPLIKGADEGTRHVCPQCEAEWYFTNGTWAKWDVTRLDEGALDLGITAPHKLADPDEGPLSV